MGTAHKMENGKKKIIQQCAW